MMDVECHDQSVFNVDLTAQMQPKRLVGPDVDNVVTHRHHHLLLVLWVKVTHTRRQGAEY